MSKYIVLLVPQALRPAANEIVNVIMGQSPGTMNFIRDCNASGLHTEPVEFGLLGTVASEAEAGALILLSSEIPAPAGGWPLTVGEAEITESDAAAVAGPDGMRIQIAVNQTSQQVLAAVLEANSVHLIEYPEA